MEKIRKLTLTKQPSFDYSIYQLAETSDHLLTLNIKVPGEVPSPPQIKLELVDSVHTSV